LLLRRQAGIDALDGGYDAVDENLDSRAVLHAEVQQPLLALFLVIASGYALGAVSVRGLSLGVGAVLFTGLFLGAVAPGAQPPGLVGTLGLVMFLYGLGVQFGGQFFAGLAGSAGRRANVLAFMALAAAALTTVAARALLGVSHAMAAGLFAGAGTNSPTMQAAMEAAGNSDPAVGYSVAYRFGLVGAILCMYLMQKLARPNVEATERSGLQALEVAIRSSGVVGRTLADLVRTLPPGVNVLAVRVRDENRHPDLAMELGAGDVLLLGSHDTGALETAREMLGEHVAGRIVADRSAIDILRVFVSRPHLEGLRIADLQLPEGVAATVTHVQRGDTEMLVTPDLALELGDRVGLLSDRKAFPVLRKYFGDSIRGTTEFSYVSLGTGMVLGVLLGSTPFPVPGLGSLKVGVAGGALVVALVLGRLGRTGPLTCTMPLSANLTLRNFGLSVFLAQVGMSSGTPFVEVAGASGLPLVVAGAAILLALALTPLVIGHYLFRIPFDDLLGITAAVTGNPAILAYAYRSLPSDRVEISYAMVFPAATIVKIVIAQVLVAAGRGGY
jgi:putative transport protein